MIGTPARLALTLALTLALGCSAEAPPAEAALPGVNQPQTGLPRIPVTIAAEKGEVVIDAEVAATPEERRIGLMWRKEMGERQGMLFLFPDESELSFWMKNTLIPLDMVFITADRKVLGVVEQATPRTTGPRQVPGQSQFVLELVGGASQRLGIRAGQAVTFFAPLPDR